MNSRYHYLKAHKQLVQGNMSKAKTLLHRSVGEALEAKNHHQTELSMKAHIVWFGIRYLDDEDVPALDTETYKLFVPPLDLTPQDEDE